MLPLVAHEAECSQLPATAQRQLLRALCTRWGLMNQISVKWKMSLGTKVSLEEKIASPDLNLKRTCTLVYARQSLQACRRPVGGAVHILSASGIYASD